MPTRDNREDVPRSRRSVTASRSAVLHAGVRHRGWTCIVITDRSVDQLADEEDVSATVNLLTNLAVQPRHGIHEDWCARCT